MATYAISDLHGAFDEFHRLLQKINFHYDGRDQLYLLGDYADWGRRSLETLLFVKDLDTRYPFVHCIMGNHEEMFLSTIESGYDNVTLNDTAALWLFANRGQRTWSDFIRMTPEEQKDLVLWMQQLPLSLDAVVGDRRYMLSHAYPFFYDVPYSETEEKAHREDALWRRMMLRENPFRDYTGSKQYYRLICGHTITDIYYQEEMRDQMVDLTTILPQQLVRNRIYFGDYFIDIDCGAKCLDLEMDENPDFRRAAQRAQLGCLRLDDGQEFYVHRNMMGMPDIRIPEVRLPQFHLPVI